ncbi:MAG: hypothetical protein IAG13_15085 [Deltaproteobacteria bacterium]|nr:hypothetical protein [Nannocystaceae bacterium]
MMRAHACPRPIQLLPLSLREKYPGQDALLLETDGDGGGDPPWTAMLLSGPAILVLGFIVSFWLARGLKAITFILRYRPQDVGGAPKGSRGGTERYRSTLAR